MKIKLSEVVSQVESIKALQDVKFPVKVSYRIKRLVDRLDPIVKAYDEKRNELIKELGEEGVDEKTGKSNISIKDPEKLKQFVDKMQELLEVEEEVEFEKISVDSLGDVKLEAKLLPNFIFE